MNWYLKVLKQYADFSGRARRKEYWMFTLFNVIIIIALFFANFIMGRLFYPIPSFIGMILTIIFYCYPLAILIPSLAVCVRRLHDIGKSGWYYLIGLIPFVGEIILFVWFCQDSQAGQNQWGANPKGYGSVTTFSQPKDDASTTISSQPDILDQIEKLAKLKESGILSEEEFTYQKKKMLEKL